MRERGTRGYRNTFIFLGVLEEPENSVVGWKILLFDAIQHHSLHQSLNHLHKMGGWQLGWPQVNGHVAGFIVIVMVGDLCS